MALFLIWAVRSYEHDTRWIHVRDFPYCRGGGDYGKLVYWGLIEPKYNIKLRYKTVKGLWSSTFKGRQFVHRKKNYCI
jgi:hypothetical protein